MAYDCELTTIIAQTEYGAIAAKFHCRKSDCEFCAERRRAQLVAIGCAGAPNRHIVLTSRVRSDQTPEEAYPDLIRSMQNLVRAIHHELKKPHELWWKIPNGYKSLKREAQVRLYAKQDAEAGRTTFQYMRTAERTQQGWPHLHLVARSPYIPQEWLSWRMSRLLDSPNVWINKIRDVAKGVGYIVGYITKEEHRFGNNRRYSFSRKYKLPPKAEYVPIVPPGARLNQIALSLHQVIGFWYLHGREVWTDGRRWYGWGEIVDPVTGEIWPRPAKTTPYDFGVAFDDW